MVLQKLFRQSCCGIGKTDCRHIKLKLDQLMQKRSKRVVQILDDWFEKGKGSSNRSPFQSRTCATRFDLFCMRSNFSLICLHSVLPIMELICAPDKHDVMNVEYLRQYCIQNFLSCFKFVMSFQLC